MGSSQTKKILFVDDEPRILEGLQRMLNHKKREWDMRFACGGEKALELLKEGAVDVIVTDMRMPKIDGATLLKQVQSSYPNVVRIVLSGYSELEMALRAIPVAHQFLSKPCNPKHLEEVVNRACDLQMLLNDQVIKGIVGKIDQLPVLPKVYQALTSALTNPQTTTKEIAVIVEQDIALSAKVLQLVNSAFFTLPKRITDVSNAVSYIGLNMLKNLALSVEAFRSFSGKNLADVSLERLQSHSLLCAHVAKKLLPDKQKSEDAFMAGMLHDIGKLILVTHLRDQFCPLVKSSQQQKQELYLAERNAFGVSHAEVGAYLLGIWGLPYPIVEAVANHHDPLRVAHKEFDVLGAVYVADRLIQDDPISAPLDMKYLESMGVQNNLANWTALAKEIKTSKEHAALL